MPTSEHGSLENPKKSAYSLEFYDSTWEKEYMEKLENIPEIKKWTKNHGIQIPYFDNDGKFHTFKPDFLVERHIIIAFSVGLIRYFIYSLR